MYALRASPCRDLYITGFILYILLRLMVLWTRLRRLCGSLVARNVVLLLSGLRCVWIGVVYRLCSGPGMSLFFCVVSG